MLDYCARCGERRLREADFSARRFLAHAFQVVTDLDSTVGRTFVNLFRRPGQLTAEFFRGRRKPYLDPLQVFLICNLVFFAVSSLGQGGVFTTSLFDHLQHHPYSRLLLDWRAAEGMTFRELLADPEAFEVYAHTYSVMTNTLAKSLIVLMVPLFAVGSYVLYRRHARFFAQHLVFALHFWAYLLLLICVVGPALLGAQVALATQGISFEWQFWDGVASLVIAILTTTYLAAAGRRAFGQTLRWTLPKAFFLTLSLLPIIWLYRLILFFATVAAI